MCRTIGTAISAGVPTVVRLRTPRRRSHDRNDPRSVVPEPDPHRSLLSAASVHGAQYLQVVTSGVRRGVRALRTAGAVVVVVPTVLACETVTQHDPPKPARTSPPAHFDEKIAWLGQRYASSRYGNLRFHSVDRHRRPMVFVNYGEQTPPDPGRGDVWHFAMTVTTAPRRPQTRRRLQRSLGPGVPVKLGTRYGCRRSGGPRRIAVLTATLRFEIGGSDCRDLLRASHQLQLA